VSQFTSDNPARKAEIASRFTDLLRHPRQRLSAKVDGRWIELNPPQLLSYSQFRAVALGQAGVFLPPCPRGLWEEVVGQRVATCKEWRS
jgi:hypothetical protein